MNNLTRLALAITLTWTSGCADDSPVGGGGAGGAGGSGSQLTWETCYESYECTSVDVPLDHDDPAGESLSIRVIRIRATGERHGVMFANQGGPGSPSVAWMAGIYPAAKILLPQTAEHYDVIAFDWRGVGESSPITCDVTAADALLRQLPLRPSTSEELAGYQQFFEGYHTGCTDDFGGALLASMSTENAARDMEVIREALGEDTIDYLGFSYGGYLGAVYASLFPSRLRSFVLDSPPHPTTDFRYEIESLAASVEQHYQDFFAWCGAAAAVDCPFHGGEGAAAVETAFEELMAGLELQPLATMNGDVTRVMAGKAIYVRIGDGQWEAVAADLASAETGDGTGLHNAAEKWFGTSSHETDTQVIYCLDRSSGQLSPAEFWELVAELEATVAPHVAYDASAHWGACVDWPYETTPITVSAKTAPAMIVIGGPNDPWTPLSEAEATVEALGNGSHLLLGDVVGHVQTDKSPCVRSVIDPFLVDAEAPVDVAACSN